MHGRFLIKINQEKNTTTVLLGLFEKTKTKPHKSWSDRGKEFHNKLFLHYLEEQNIQIYSTNSDLKAVFVERFNRTLLDLNEEPMYIEGKACWLDHLDAAMEKFINRVHGTTKMTPFEMSNNNKINNSTAKLASQIKKKLPKFQVGDYVRFPEKRNLYGKGYTTSWNGELFKIHKINQTNPVTYDLVDENNEQKEPKYYEQDFLRSVFNFESNQKVFESMNIFHQNE